jgi:hypothetical protein
MTALVSCRACLRHVKATESVCPFCGAGVVADAPAALARFPGRLGRLALVALGTAAFFEVACHDDAAPDAKSPSHVAPPGASRPLPSDPANTMAAAYGAPPPSPHDEPTVVPSDPPSTLDAGADARTIDAAPDARPGIPVGRPR